jgi:hypothetical protein
LDAFALDVLAAGSANNDADGFAFGVTASSESVAQN